MKRNHRKSKIVCLFAVLCGMSSWSYGQAVEQITMTTSATKIHLAGAFACDVVEATIDWGDGTEEALKMVDHRFKASRDYTGEMRRKIIITLPSGCITVFECFKNQLSDLSVNECKTLVKLDCSQNQLTELDVNECRVLTELSCAKNQLTALDVSKNKTLIELLCDYNQLTTLNVSNNTALS
ncbi:MAG: hypothetical protein LBN37_06340, partial [Bacteroidales bacterium]|nr:hypothetical protein [Bacteroidales bacterium]